MIDKKMTKGGLVEKVAFRASIIICLKRNKYIPFDNIEKYVTYSMDYTLEFVLSIVEDKN